jgi:hypothetical protein
VLDDQQVGGVLQQGPEPDDLVGGVVDVDLAQDGTAIATRDLAPARTADSGEVLHARQRTGRANSARGAARFVDELALARLRCGPRHLSTAAGLHFAGIYP